MPAPSAGDTSPARPLLPAEQPPPRALSPWLRLMLAEIARKRDELEQARAEQLRRASEAEHTLFNRSRTGPGV